jgi:hypothetical protein
VRTRARPAGEPNAPIETDAPDCMSTPHREGATNERELNGSAHILLTVIDPPGIPFWERLCHFLEMKTLPAGDRDRPVAKAVATFRRADSRISDFSILKCASFRRFGD